MENFKLLIAEQRLSNTGAALTGFQKEIFDSPYVSCGSHKGTTSDDDMNLKPNSLPVYPFVLELKLSKPNRLICHGILDLHL